MVKNLYISVVLFIFVFMPGCQTTGKAYNFVESGKFGGYVINRKGVILPEYTIGVDGLAPADLELAEKRFRRRKGTVDKYYKKMGVIIDSNVEMAKTMGGMMAGPFALPFKIVDHNRYINDPEYKKMVDEQEEQEEETERKEIESLKQELAEWVKEDLRINEGIEAEEESK